MKTAQEIVAGMRSRCRLKDSEPVGIIPLRKVSIGDDGPKNPRNIACIATTDGVDLDREVVLPGGADVGYFMQNRAVFLDHEYDYRSVIGKLRSISPWPNAAAQRGWSVKIGLVSSKANPDADRVLELAREGLLGVSVGYVPDDYGRPTAAEGKLYPNAESIVRLWRWLELSLTALRCNIECRATVIEDAAVPPAKRRIVVFD